MMQHEFEELIEEPLAASEWETINFVYTWNPALQRMSKEAAQALLANIYREAGMMMIKDLEWSAEYMCEADNRIRKQQARIALANQRIIAIRDEAQRWAETREEPDYRNDQADD